MKSERKIENHAPSNTRSIDAKKISPKIIRPSNTTNQNKNEKGK